MKDNKRILSPNCQSDNSGSRVNIPETPSTENSIANTVPPRIQGITDLKISDILEALPFYVMLIDEGHHILQVNHAVQAQFGLKSETIIGQYCPKIIHGLDRPWDSCPLEEAVEKNRAVEREALDQKSGRWIRSAVYPIGRFRDGNKIFLHMVSDITDRKQAEEELQHNYDIEIVLNRLLQISLENIPLKDILQRVLEMLISIPWLSLEAKGCIFLVKDKPERLFMAVHKGLDDSLLKTCEQIPFGKCLCGMSALEKKVVFVDRIDKSHTFRYEGITPHGHYCIPIMLKGKVLGVINTYVRHGHTYSDREERFLMNVSNLLAGIVVRKQTEDNLRISQNQLRELAKHLESVREEEKTALAREIHDDLGQILTGLKMDAVWMSKKIPQNEISLTGKAKAMGNMIDTAIETLRRVSSQLRPAVLDYLGLTAAIEWQIKELQKHSEINFELKSNPGSIDLDRNLSTAIFRICQEALTNVIRHADATSVKIGLREERNSIVLKIKDNGKGIIEEHISDPKSFGLLNMKERALYWGGQLEIKGIPGKGTSVSVRIPRTDRGE